MKISKVLNKFKLFLLKKAKTIRSGFIIPNKKILIIIASIIIVLSLGFLFKSLFVVVIVNGKPISRLALIRDLEKAGGSQTLDNLIAKTLIEQEAKAKGVSLTQEEIDKEVKTMLSCGVCGEDSSLISSRGNLER